MVSKTELESMTADELREEYDDISGRWDMKKADLIDAILDAELDEVFVVDFSMYEEGMTVIGNWLSIPLVVEDVTDTSVTLTTIRGGRHQIRRNESGGMDLMRWRAGDEKWMHNADDATSLEILDEYEVHVSLFANVDVPGDVSEDNVADLAIGKLEMPDPRFDKEIDVLDIVEQEDQWNVGVYAHGVLTVQATSFEAAQEAASAELEDSDVGDFHTPEWHYIENTRTEEVQD